MRHLEIHELNTGYVVEIGSNSHSFQDLSEVVRFTLILEKDEQKRKELAAQILDVFERVYKDKNDK
jgi:hypothetical protein